MPGLKNITKIAAGCNHILALSSDGKVYTWGFGEQSQLGRRVLQRSMGSWGGLIPRNLGLKNIIDLGSGSDHSFAIDASGKVYSWGLNNFGQTGISTNAGGLSATVTIPTVVESLTNLQSGTILQVSGGNKHSLARSSEGHCYSWGQLDSYATGMKLDNLPDEGVIRDARGNPRILTRPTPLPGLRVSFVAACGDHSIAISQDGQPFSWGFNSGHQTGQKDDDDVEVPTKIECKATRGKEFIWAGGGGQFSVLAEKVAMDE